MRLVSKRIENARNRVQPKGRDTVKVGPEVWQWLKERQYEATKRGEKITQGDIILGLIKNAKGVPQLISIGRISKLQFCCPVDPRLKPRVILKRWADGVSLKLRRIL